MGTRCIVGASGPGEVGFWFPKRRELGPGAPAPAALEGRGSGGQGKQAVRGSCQPALLFGQRMELCWGGSRALWKLLILLPLPNFHGGVGDWGGW